MIKLQGFKQACEDYGFKNYVVYLAGYTKLIEKKLFSTKINHVPELHILIFDDIDSRIFEAFQKKFADDNQVQVFKLPKECINVDYKTLA